MDIIALARDGGGWMVAVAMAAMFIRALMNGDLVLGREYTRVTTEMSAISDRAESLAQEQRDSSRQERQEFLDRLAQKQATIDRMTGDRGSP